ncbi:MAG: ribonuclease HI [Deferrisomatales bacterium]|nr:ribonuclease HI [Deferrisomatales bacterium]
MPNTKLDDQNELIIYTDGGCIGNPGPGGWAAVLVRAGQVEELGGAAAGTTNNRMEMRAAIEGLRRARPGERARVVTDSRYLQDGITRWIHGWKRRNWKKADGNPVLNQDLWQELDTLIQGPAGSVCWEHVRGHQGHPFNERCDEIANGFARGTPPELRRGDGSWIGGTAAPVASIPSAAPATPTVGVPSGMGFPFYLSYRDGELRLHGDWADCEAWVKGVRGVRYKKVRSPAELGSTLTAWGIGAGQAARQLGVQVSG